MVKINLLGARSGTEPMLLSRCVEGLILTHHGRQVLGQGAECEKMINRASEESVIPISIAYDGMSYCI